MSEALALLRKGVQITKALDLVNCVIEFDKSTLVNVVNGVSCPDWRCFPIIEDLLVII